MSVPPRIRVLNKVLPQGFARWRLSSAAALEASARDSLGTTAELTPETRTALEELLRSYADTARLHPLGEIMTAMNLLSLLKNQLSLTNALDHNPDTATRTVQAPIIITGLPRTGSTLLHNLLALDDSLRVPMSWEVTYPAPLANSQWTRRQRIWRTQARFALIEGLHPGFRAIHELDALLPQECLVITAAAMRSHLFFSSAFVPGYQDWLDEQSAAPMYTVHRLLLQHLQGSQTPTWALKAPSHLFSMDGLLAAYPNCHLVHTHRAPESVIASIASLQSHLYRTFSEFNDNAELGRQVASRWGSAYQSLQTRLKADPQLRRRSFQLDYESFVRAPLEQVKALYAHLGRTLSAATLERMSNYLEQRPQHQFGRHRYELADYALTESGVRSAFGLD